jgi:hypothetical protein
MSIDPLTGVNYPQWREKINMGLTLFEIDKAIMDKTLRARSLPGGAIPECETTVEYLEKVESQFTGSSKAYASSLIKRLISEKYTGDGVRDHILRMSNAAARLKPFDLAIKDGFFIYLIFNSLMKEFETFEVNYNSMNDKWTLKKFVAMCVQEEERIKCNNGGVDSVNMAKHHQKRKNPPQERRQRKSCEHELRPTCGQGSMQVVQEEGPLLEELH